MSTHNQSPKIDVTPNSDSLRTFNVFLAESGKLIEVDGRCKVTESWVIFSNSDEAGSHIVLALPRESVLYFEVA